METWYAIVVDEGDAGTYYGLLNQIDAGFTDEGHPRRVPCSPLFQTHEAAEQYVEADKWLVSWGAVKEVQVDLRQTL